MSAPSVLSTALALATKYGVSVVPVAGNDWVDGETGAALRKRPAYKNGCIRGLAWDPFKNRRMAETEIKRKFADVPNIGAIMGEVSGFAEAIDFDRPGMYEGWRELLSENGHDDLLARLFIQSTQTPGHFQVLYRCPEGIEGGRKLAWYYDESEIDTRTGQPKRKASIETRGEGNYVIIPPSEGYSVVQGSIAKLPDITAEERALLLDAARYFEEAPEGIPEPVQAERGSDGREILPADAFNTEASWDDILPATGARFVRQRGALSQWVRDGKSAKDGISFVTGLGRSGQDYMRNFSSNAPPFQENTTYSKFDAYALLNHGGDKSAAAKDLYAKGYGSRATAKQREQRTEDHSPAATGGGQEGATRLGHSPDSSAEQAKTSFLSLRLRWSQLKELPPKPMLIKGILGVGDSAMIVGLRKGGKTAVTFDMLLAMLSGGKFAGKFEVLRPLTVAYFTTEGLGGIHTRLECANTGHRVDDYCLEEHFIFVPKLPQCFDDESEHSVLKVAQEIKDAGIRLDVMVIDTFAKAIQGAEENSNSDMSRALSTLQKAREILGCATILLHHVNKSGTLRGASAIDGDLDVLLQVEWNEETNDRAFAFGFAKDLGPFDAIPFELDVVDTEVPGSIRVNWTPGRRNHGMSALERILAVMRQDPGSLWTVSQIRAILGDLQTNTIQTALSRETDKAEPKVAIIKEGEKAIRYRLTPKGQW